MSIVFFPSLIGADLKAAVIQQPVLSVIKPGSNVTLQCSVQVKMCDKGVQLVYWFRQGSDTIHPGIVYTHGDTNNECGKNFAASTSNVQSCLYNLPKINVGVSDAGMYYCAVVTCEEVLFGNGTTLVIEGNCLIFLRSALLSKATCEVGTSQAIYHKSNTVFAEHNAKFQR